ncbi:MAG: carboxypeptidase-like regulatory domain-containing protein [Planctomycetota bacterium]
MRGLLLVLAVLGAAIAGWLLLRDEGVHSDDVQESEAELLGDGRGATLHGTPMRPAPPRDADAASPPPARPPAVGPEGEAPPFLTGLVVDADEGSPIAGAHVWVEAAAEPLDRLPRHLGLYDAETDKPPGPGSALGLDGRLVGAFSDADGRFRILEAPDGVTHVDVFALATGRLAAMNGPRVAGENVVLRMEAGLELTGTVRGPRGRPLVGARLVARPAPGTRPSLRHVAVATSREDGSFRLGALAPGNVLVRCEHPSHLPAELGPVDPATSGPLAFELAAALHVTFELAPSDAVEPVHPSVEFRTDAPQPETGLTLLRARIDVGEDGKLPGVWTYQPVPVPCRGRTVTFTVKAEKHAPWTSDPVDLPVEGGSTTVRVPLVATLGSAQARVAFRDESGQVVTYGSLGASLELVMLSGSELPAGAVVEGADELVLRSVPEGRYRIVVRSPSYAPASVEVEATTFDSPATEVTLEAAAKVRVIFRATEAMTVPFRIYESGRAIPVFRDGVRGDATQAPVGGQEGGDVFTGLGKGVYEVIVSSDQLEARPTSFRAEPGETVEVEIDVSRK